MTSIARLCHAFAAALLFALSACASPPPSAAGPGPQEPIAIPLALDKAGAAIDTTFWVAPGRPKGKGFHYVGLHVLFTAGDRDGRLRRMDDHPVKVKVTLHRIKADGQEEKVALYHAVNVSPSPHGPQTFASEVLPDDIGTSRSDSSYSPDVTPDRALDAATATYSFAGPDPLAAGRYRLRVVTQSDLPALSNIPARLVFERSDLPE